MVEIAIDGSLSCTPVGRGAGSGLWGGGELAVAHAVCDGGGESPPQRAAVKYAENRDPRSTIHSRRPGPPRQALVSSGERSVAADSSAEWKGDELALREENSGMGHSSHS